MGHKHRTPEQIILKLRVLAGPFATDEDPGLRAALRECERALEGCDADPLALLCGMNRYERGQLR